MMTTTFAARSAGHFQPSSRPGFTLVEMLIAMAVTLILVSALASGFAFVGQSIRDGRGEVELSNQLRDITERMREELNAMTVSLSPNSGGPDQLGYFVYHEGPMTDATSSIFGAERSPADPSQVVLNHSRYGDFDDYMAFTAVATGDTWFTGKVPQFVLDQKTAQLSGVAYDPTAFSGDPLNPVVIRSKYAEIIYFASPEYVRTSLPATPLYADLDANGLPNNLRLHRRVLLIRPDLNIEDSSVVGGLRVTPLPIAPATIRVFDGMPFPSLLADNWPTITAATSNTVNPGVAPADAWLYGMAGVHQQCDLSLRRVLDADEGPPSRLGLPTRIVAANSLADLAKPHNRFAHVRAPGNEIGLGTANVNITSMPILALGAPAAILDTRAELDNNVRLSPPPTPSGAAVVRPNRWSGFLRPEFVLGGDYSHLNNSADAWGLERIGEDIIANNVVGFDVKVFDPQAISISTLSGMIVGSNDPGFREAVLEYAADTTANKATRLMHGDYVDLAYPVLAGGSLRGWGPMRRDRLATANTDPVNASVASLLATPFSGIVGFGNLSNSYTPAIYRSGKLLISGGGIQFFQPTFDTYTSAYEVDGLLQGFERTGSPVAAADVGGAGNGTRWTTYNDANLVDRGSNGLDDDGLFGADDDGERETLAPFQAKASAIRVTIRLENRDNRQLKQASVVHRDGD